MVEVNIGRLLADHSTSDAVDTPTQASFWNFTRHDHPIQTTHEQPICMGKSI